MRAMDDDTPAYSETSGKQYANWDALVKAETNGWVVVIMSTRKNTAPYVLGPFKTKADAHRARVRNVYHAKKDEHPSPVRSFVRHLWKDER